METKHLLVIAVLGITFALWVSMIATSVLPPIN